MINLRKILLSIIVSIAMSGCSGYKSTFDCPLPKSVSCESVSTVDRLVNDEKLEDYINEKDSKGCGCKSCRDKYVNHSKKQVENTVFENTELEKAEESDNFKIYFNDYRDDAGVNHKSSEVEVGIK